MWGSAYSIAIVSDQLNPQNSPRRGRHRLDDDFDEYDDYGEYSENGQYGAYSENSAAVSATGAAGASGTAGASGAAGAAGAGASGAEADSSVGDGAGQGRSLRILAAVCLFIGVCLVGYGIYAFSTGGGSDEQTPSETVVSSQTNGSESQSSSQDVPPPPPPAAPSESGVPMPPPAASDAAKPEDKPQGQERAEEGAPADAPRVDRGATKITVLNNSQVTGLADKVSEKVGGQGWGRGATGNAPENEMGIWEKTTVYFAKDNAKEKAAAEELARENGWVTAPRDERLEGKPVGIVVIVTDQAN